MKTRPRTRPPGIGDLRICLLAAALTLRGFTACTSGDPGADEVYPSAVECRAGEPRPIFADDAPYLLRHEFRREGQVSTETAATASDSLVIEQAGCDTLVQAFTFAVADSVVDWAGFRRDAANRFTAWAQADPQLFAFEQYARAVTSVPPEYPEGQPADLAPGLTLRAYPLPTTAPRRWRLRLEQDLTGAAPAQ